MRIRPKAKRKTIMSFANRWKMWINRKAKNRRRNKVASKSRSINKINGF